MTIFSGSVGASEDDAFEFGTGVVSINQTSSNAVDSSSEYLGFRFQNVTIPNGATINSAYISLYPVDDANDEPLGTWYGDDVDNAAAFAASTNDISGRTSTTATVAWDNADLGQDASGTNAFNTPDLATIVQEIVNRAGWASGNAMAYFYNGSSGARDLAVFFFDSGSKYASITIDYTAGGGDPEGSLLGGKLIRGGLLLGGVLVR